MEFKVHYLHPAAVHFPIAILILGAAAGVRRRAKDESLLLWLGTLALWAALGLGLLAEKTVTHVPAAWEVLADHEELAWRTAFVFTALSALRWHAVRKGLDRGYWRVAQGLLWVAGLGLLAATAMHGGELVFGFGVGVAGR